MRALLPTVVLTGLFCPLAGAQNTWIVDGLGRPWSHFTDVPAAFAAAAPGDSIWVYASSGVGTYALPAVIDKPIRIVGMGVTGYPGSPPLVNVFGPVVVRNIPAGGRVVMSHLGIVVRSQVLFAPPWMQPHGIEVQNCAGHVHLERLVYSPFGHVNSSLLFEDCASVSVHSCEWIFLSAPVTCRRSTVQISNTTIQPSQTYSLWPGPPWTISQTVEGLRAESSDVTLIGTSVWGASYENATVNPERVAVDLIDSTLRAGPRTGLLGGRTAQGLSGPAIRAVGTSRILLDHRMSQSGIHPASTVPAQRTWIHAVDHGYVTRNELISLTVWGPPGGFLLLGAGDHRWPGLATGIGTLAIDPGTLTVVGTAAVPGSGQVQYGLFASRYLPIGHPFAFQAAVLDPQGNISLTLPSPFTVGWEAGRSLP